jgi:hypothetical protein
METKRGRQLVARIRMLGAKEKSDDAGQKNWAPNRPVAITDLFLLTAGHFGTHCRIFALPRHSFRIPRAGKSRMQGIPVNSAAAHQAMHSVGFPFNRPIHGSGWELCCDNEHDDFAGFPSNTRKLFLSQEIFFRRRKIKLIFFLVGFRADF